MRTTANKTSSAPKIYDGIRGEGIVVNRTSAGGYVLHEVRGGTVRELGMVEHPVDAWRVLDALDTAAL